MPKNSGTNSSDGSSGDHSQHDGLYHLVYVLGYSILSLTIDFTFIWPEDHLYALLFLAAAFSLLALWEMRKCTTEWKIVVIGIAFIAALTTNAIVGPVHRPETEFHGWLEAANVATPENACSKVNIPPSALLVLFGNNATYVMERIARVLRVGNCVAASVEREGSKLAVNTDIFDTEGELIARIEKNEFHLTPGKISYPKRSDDRSALTVYDKQGKRLFFIRFLNPSAVQIEGVFTCGDGISLEINDHSAIGHSPMIDNLVMENICVPTRRNSPSQFFAFPIPQAFPSQPRQRP